MYSILYTVLFTTNDLPLIVYQILSWSAPVVTKSQLSHDHNSKKHENSTDPHISKMTCKKHTRCAQLCRSKQMQIYVKL